MPTVAEIAALALNAVDAAIPDATHSASLSFETQGAYNAVTGAYATTITTYTGGRAVVDTVKPVADIFPDYVVGPSDSLIFLEGFVNVPQENWTLTFNGNDWAIKRVQDILDAGTIFFVMAAPK